MDPIPALEGKCCLGCKTEVVKMQDSLVVLLTTGVSIHQIAHWFENADVDALRDSMPLEKWIQVQNLAYAMVLTSAPGTDLPILHDRFGQAKMMQFRHDTALRPVGTLAPGVTLEVICRQRRQQHVEDLFLSMAAQLVEANIALRHYNDLDLRRALDCAVVISPHYETVKIVYPTKAGYATEDMRLPAEGQDLPRLLRRVDQFLDGGRAKCRAVFIDNIFGLGTPDEARALPEITRWINRIGIRRWSKPIWLVLGIIIPDENPFNRMTGLAVENQLNERMNHRNVWVLNLCGPLEAKVDIREIIPRNRFRAILEAMNVQ